MVSNNDDRSSSDFDSRMVPVLRHSSEAYYLVVTHSAFAPSGRFTGAYRVNITRTTDVTVPSAERQVVVLEFNGGTIQSSSLGNEVIGPFDAAAISRVYEGADEEMKESIVDTIVQNFERLKVFPSGLVSEESTLPSTLFPPPPLPMPIGVHDAPARPSRPEKNKTTRLR